MNSTSKIRQLDIFESMLNTTMRIITRIFLGLISAVLSSNGFECQYSDQEPICLPCILKDLGACNVFSFLFFYGTQRHTVKSDILILNQDESNRYSYIQGYFLLQ